MRKTRGKKIYIERRFFKKIFSKKYIHLNICMYMRKIDEKYFILHRK